MFKACILFQTKQRFYVLYLIQNYYPGAIEGQWFRKTGRLISLSEQQLVDCSKKFGNAGCDGGLMESGFTYAMNHKMEPESSYPYTAQDGQCTYVINKGTFSVSVARLNSG